ncbi:MAG: hypothetical protein P1V97_22755, partial [Planctomycetota bacterium]|nr:hypothetical protein [Planctomycetota bacterium]
MKIKRVRTGTIQRFLGICFVMFIAVPAVAQDNSERTEKASRDGVRRIRAELKRLETARRKWVPKESALALPKIPTQSPVLKIRRKVLPLTLN